MPQISPMFWLFLYMFFIMSWGLIFIKTYYNK